MIGGRDQSRRSEKSAERRPREFSPNVLEGVEVGIGSIPPDLTHEPQFLERTTQRVQRLDHSERSVSGGLK
jgi:hypothetical protein